MCCAQLAGAVFLQNKEVYCREHLSLAEGKEVVPERAMRVDRCVAVHTSSERPGRRLVRAVSPSRLQLRVGELVDCAHGG